MLNKDERAWINAYHAQVRAKIGPQLSPEDQAWLETATAPV
jgi:Xaa-Pro aminopeptidase